MSLRYLLFLVTVLCSLVSCEKGEDAIVLPPRGTASHDSIVMGGSYENQVFYDFETGKAVYTSANSLWDLAFEASPAGRHIFLNGGQKVFVYNTHQPLMQNAKIATGMTATGIVGWQY